MKPMDVIYLKACQLKHRDPSEKITEEQFIINDDDGMYRFFQLTDN